MNRRRARFLGGASLLVAMLATIFALASNAQDTSPSGASSEQIADLRRQMQSLQRQREATAQASALIPWKTTSRDLPAPPGSGMAAVCLVNNMQRLRAVWTFVPADAAGETMRVPIPVRGEEWIALPAGTYQAQLAFGSPRTGRQLKIDPFEVVAKSGGRFELVLDSDAEQKLNDRLAQSAKEAAAADAKTSEASDDTRAPDDMSDVPRGSVSVEIKSR